MNDFSGAMVNDRVWSVEFGWGTIDSITLGPRTNETLPGSGPIEKLHIRFDIGGPMMDYFVKGNRYLNYAQTLFWGEAKILAPSKPKKKLKKVMEGYLEICRCGRVMSIIGRTGILSVLPATKNDCCSHNYSYEKVVFHHEYEDLE